MWMKTTSSGSGARRAAISLAAAVMMAGATITMAQPAPGGPGGPGAQADHRGPRGPRDGRHEDQDEGEAVSLNGSVEGWNFNPRGEVESLMLKISDKTVQVNFPPDMGDAVKKAAGEGGEVKVSAIEEHGAGDHPVYRAKSVQGKEGAAVEISDPRNRAPAKVEGTIKRLNYGRGGEMNGVVLENGDIVLMGPAGASIPGMTVGQKIAATGRGHAMADGHQVIEADAVNGNTISHGPRGEGPGPRGGPGMRGGPRGRGGPDGQRGPKAPGAGGNEDGGPPGPPPPPQQDQ